MNFKYLILLVCAALLVGCANTVSQQAPAKEGKQSASQAKRPPIALERMDTQFLYLASQQALGQQQPALAARFLKALVKKEPNDVQPRLELVEILLISGQPNHIREAKRLMDGAPEESLAKLDENTLSAYQLLYARTLITSGEPAEASLLLEDMVTKYPENEQLRLLLARLYMVDKQYQRAHQVLDAGLKYRRSLKLQQMKVQVYLQQGNTKQADKTLSVMQKQFPDNEDIVLQRAHIAEKTQNPIKAEALLQIFIDENQNTAVQSYSMLAGLYVRANRLEKAKAIYTKMLSLTDDDASVYMSLGKIYYQQQLYLDAQAQFKQAVAQLRARNHKMSMTNELATALFYSAASLEASHQQEKAMLEYKQLLPRHNLYLDAQLRLASIDLGKQKYEDTEQRLDALKTDFPHDIGVHELWSGLRLKQEKYQALIAESDKALDLGFSAVISFNRAIALEKLKQFEVLDETLETLIARQPNHAEALNFYGYSLADRGVRLPEAQAMIERALLKRTNDGYYLDSLAWVYYKQGFFTKALETQIKAIHVIKDDAVMLEHLGDIYWQQKQAENAREAWQKAIDLGHDDAPIILQKIQHGLM